MQAPSQVICPAAQAALLVPASASTPVSPALLLVLVVLFLLVLLVDSSLQPANMASESAPHANKTRHFCTFIFDLWGGWFSQNTHVGV